MTEIMDLNSVIEASMEEGAAAVRGETPILEKAETTPAGSDSETPPVETPPTAVVKDTTPAGQSADPQTLTMKGVDFTIPEGASLDDLKSGKVKLTFTSDGETQEVTLAKAIAWAQQMKIATKREGKLRTERNEAIEKAKGADKYKEAADSNDTLLKAILKGGPEADTLLREMRGEYAKVLGNKPPVVDEKAPTTSSTDETAAAGAELATKIIKPHAEALAKGFEGADALEIAQEIVTLLSEEPNLDWDLVDDILHRRILEQLEAAGYTQTAEVEKFDLTSWREGTTQETEEKKVGLRPKGAAPRRGAETPAEKALRVENENLKRKLQEHTLRGAPPGPSPVGGGKTPKGPVDAGLKSDLIDVSGAKSVAEVMATLQAVGN